jgi:C_GCAxxG_C_C family probable redox protein
MTKSEIAANYFKNSFNCSQAVFTALAPQLGISEENSLKIACAFGGGIARNQLICGAVTGALMAIGLKYGKGLNDDDSRKGLTYQKSNLLFEKFKQKHKSISCRELLDGLDMEKDKEKIKSLNLFNTKCPLYVKDATAIAEAIINDTEL